MSSVPEIRRYTHAEYVALENAAEFKHEFIDGQLWAMSGAHPRHNLISLNVGALFHRAFADGPCQALSSDQRVYVQAWDVSCYPDVTVVCEPWKTADGDVYAVINPAILVEVLSPTTTRYDQRHKANFYRSIPSLRDFLLVSVREPRVEHHRRIGPDQWLLTTHAGADVVVELSSGLVVRAADVYAGIDRLPD